MQGQAQSLIGGMKKEKPLHCKQTEQEARILAENTSELRHQLRLRQSNLWEPVEEAARNYTLAMQRHLYDVSDK
ncbi:hypothetical protein NDU88_003318 [Pleurodeles waltl]|uniref:Uncharacterized protein n=1 Tax=Pleurodeles waltl TaxID=8319 RepID=A0AAV7UC75_PLEWA|nr:hypothetical protein NDU88_003318 [Pleurodeles waltl]